MPATIYHNPRCSKSRNTLALLEERGVELDVVRYLDTPPDAATLLAIGKALDMPLKALIRRGETAFKSADDLPDLNDDAALAAWLSTHPIVIERPIVVTDDGKARIGRPPEAVLEVLP